MSNFIIFIKQATFVITTTKQGTYKFLVYWPFTTIFTKQTKEIFLGTFPTMVTIKGLITGIFKQWLHH